MPDGLSPAALAALQQHYAEQEEPSGAPAETQPCNRAAPSHQPGELNVAEYGSNEYWAGRWAEAQEAQEWFIVGADKIWPHIEQICADMGLCGGQPLMKALELGAGTSRLALDLVTQYQLNGVVVTDLAGQPMAMQTERAVGELGERAGQLLRYEEGDCCAMGYADGQFRMVMDKGTNDCIRLSEEPGLLGRFVDEVARVLEPRGVYVYVTCQHEPELEPWLQAFEHHKTEPVLRDGPQLTNLVVLRKS